MLALSSKAFGKIETSGKITAFGGAYVTAPKDKDLTSKSGGIETSLDFQKKISKSFRFQADGWMKYDGLNQSEDEVFQFEPEELSIDYRKSGRKIKLGLSSRAWEGTDLINPMDIIHTKNYREPLEIRTLAAPGLFYDDSIGNFSWDLTYLAIQQKSKFPGTNSPWLPRNLYMPTDDKANIVLLPEQVEYSYEDDVERDNALTNNVALRLQYVGSFMDFSIGGFEGASSPPVLLPAITATVIGTEDGGNITIVQAGDQIRIQPVYHRERAVAAATSMTLGSWIIRLSANHRQPMGKEEKPATPTWSQLGVLGIEKTFYPKNQMLTFILQGITSRRPKSEGLSLLSSLYEESYMLGIRYAPSEKWTWMQAIFQEQIYYSYFYHSDISWNFRDSWSLVLNANFFQGSPASHIGNFSKNDQVVLKTSYSF